MPEKVEFKDDDLFLPIEVYKFPLGNCGGITDSVKSIYMPCEDGFIKFKDIENKELIFYPEQRGPEYHALKPYTKQDKWTMSGGNLAYSCDSRCKHVYHIHDRIEG
jgi:hypothetical protein